ncbi:hypothetical protein ACFV3E_42815 [Streptomyces sp. NPDC059718]
MTSHATDSGTQLIAGEVPLATVMDRLRHNRPVFHSEADLQHAFARTLWEIAPHLHSRLEVRQPASDRIEHLDLLCIGPTGRTAVEFKHCTRAWNGTAGNGTREEQYALTSHAAIDLARLGFITDITRLERFCHRPDQNGLALLVTNVPALWTAPSPTAKPSRDQMFRLHQEHTLTGTLLWGTPDRPHEKNTRTLHGTYTMRWQDYSLQEGTGGEFRYLPTFVNPQPS